MPKPLVSIITPSFNQAHYIGDTIESVLSQDYDHLEYLIYDGGSIDDTVDLLRQIDDPRLKWVSEPDAGQPDAINKGLKACQGDIITYINSDDLLLPGAVSDVVAAFQQYPEHAMIYGDGIRIDAEGRQIGAGKGVPFDLARVLSGRVYIPQQGAFWHREAMDTIGLFDPDLHYVLDIDYWLRMVAAGYTLHYVPGERAAYRLHTDSKTVSQVQRFWQDWDAMLDKFFTLPDLPDEMRALRIHTRPTHWRLYCLYSSWSYDPVPAFRPLIRQLITGPVPWHHRVIAGLMLADSYLGTAITRKALGMSQTVRSSRQA